MEVISKKNLKYFFIIFILSLPFWWGINIFQEKLENFLFWEEMADNSKLLMSQMIQEEKLAKLKPIRNRQVEDLEIEAKSAISVLVDNSGDEKILFKKESTKPLPIASLTKLMTANVVLEYYDLQKIVSINQEAAELTGLGKGKLKVGESFYMKDLLYPMLIESNNSAAFVLAEELGQAVFTELMNFEAERKIGMKNTYFVNPTGLDAVDSNGTINYSTAEDLKKLSIYLLKTKPEVWKISITPQFELYSWDGILQERFENTNELLSEIPGIIGGKTGWTNQAQGCFLLIIKSPQNRGLVINIILGSQDRFGEMKKLINWLNYAYKW